jgi:manganese/zinc/iron transport system substrate-binding protein
MGPGVDPHLYKPTERDVRRLSGADLILYNGLHLEGKMGEILEKLGRSRAVVPVAEAVPTDQLRSPPEFVGAYDPHVWFDVRLWMHTIDPALEALVRLRPEAQPLLRERAEDFRRRLGELDSWVEEQIASLPEGQRVLVTAHDAFGYFGQRYGMEVVGLQGISTVTEATIRDIERVVDLLVSRGIKAIFVEASVPRRNVEAVREACRDRGHQIEIGGELFSDSMGPSGTPEGTYIGMVRANVRTIVGALK